METKVSMKEQFEDGLSFLEFLRKDYRENQNEIVKTDIKDLDYLEGYCRMKKDNPKVIQMKEIFEQEIFNKMIEYFVENDECLTKKNIRSYISGYKKMFNKPLIPLYYFFTDEDIDNLLIEWFENDLGELLFQKRVRDGNSIFPFWYLDIFECFTREFVEEMLSSDIKTITKKLIQTLPNPIKSSK